MRWLYGSSENSVSRGPSALSPVTTATTAVSVLRAAEAHPVGLRLFWMRAELGFVWQLGECREPRAIRAFAGHDSHYCGFGAAGRRSSSGWSEVVLDETPACVCLLGGISVPAG